MCPSDGECIEQCLNGRPDAFRHLVQRYETPLVSYLARRLVDAEAAEEVAQETFVRAYFQLDTLRKREALFAWLLGISQRVMREHVRSRQRERRLSEQAEPAAPATDLAKDGDSELVAAVAALPEVYREVTVLRYFGQLSCAEVSKRLDVPLGTVTKRLSRAYGLLRESLATHDGHPNEVRR